MPKERPDFDFFSFHELFGPTSTYVVPKYQRGYAWGTEQVEQLLADLHDSYANSPENFYLLGQAIVCKADGKFELVDGQQRLTTLFLLVSLARTRLQEHSNEFSVLKKARFEGVTALILVEAEKERLVPTLTAAQPCREFVHAIANSEPLPEGDQNPSQENVRNTVEIIDAWYEKNFTTPLELFDFLWFALNHVLILRLCLTDVQEALVVFQKMNNRGLALDDADLLKNLLFIKADEDEFVRLSKSWDDASQSIYGSRLKRAKSMEFLLKAMIGIETGKSVPTPRIFEEWEDKLKDADAAHKFAESLNDKAIMISRASNNRSFANEEISETPGTFLFKWVQHLEVLLAGMHLELASYRHLCEIVDNRAMLSMLSGEKNQDLERLLHKWAAKVSALPSDADRASILKASSDVLGNYGAMVEQMRLEVPRLSYEVKTQREKLRYCLARIAQTVEENASNLTQTNELVIRLTKPVTRGSKKYHIDHVFPKSERRRLDWPDQDKAKQIHSIGNLVLLHPDDNQDKGDSLPSEEITRSVLGGSKLLINRCMLPAESLGVMSPREQVVINTLRSNRQVDLEDWGPTQVELRQALYLDLLVESFDKKLT